MRTSIISLYDGCSPSRTRCAGFWPATTRIPVPPFPSDSSRSMMTVWSTHSRRTLTVRRLKTEQACFLTSSELSSFRWEVRTSFHEFQLLRTARPSYMSSISPSGTFENCVVTWITAIESAKEAEAFANSNPHHKLYGSQHGGRYDYDVSWILGCTIDFHRTEAYRRSCVMVKGA